MHKQSVLALLILVTSQSALALTVQVLGRDTPVDLGGPQFERFALPGGKLIEAIYYEAGNQHAVYQEGRIYHQRCEVPTEAIAEWVKQERPDSYYDRKVDDRYDCDSDNTPDY